MRSPDLSELPPPPSDKTGWPWTGVSKGLPAIRLDSSPCPRVTIVTPSYNQAEFIEETIRSILLQGYPNLEYIIIDGGSSDSSIEIIRKYEPWLKHWVSEPDSGQSEALNKGFGHATGSILTWLNSDDRLQPGAIQAAVEFFLQHPNVGIVYGDYNIIEASGELLGSYKSPDFDLHHQIVRQLITQPAAFFRGIVWDQVGPLNTKFHYIMDRDFWTRAALTFPIVHMGALIADVRFHDKSKTVAQTVNFLLEERQFLDDFFSLPNLPAQIKDFESQARGANYFSTGREYLRGQNKKEARNALEYAWNTYPLHYNKLIIIPFWLDTIFNTNIGLPLFRLVTRLKNPGQFSA
ncbi:MAG: glycosyltransferase [Chloroflexi bacterium]|nr:MAG: glycosyltransferase [Chloroflexota bacterium]